MWRRRCRHPLKNGNVGGMARKITEAEGKQIGGAWAETARAVADPGPSR
jgi:hypothetical protein